MAKAACWNCHITGLIFLDASTARIRCYRAEIDEGLSIGKAAYSKTTQVLLSRNWPPPNAQHHFFCGRRLARRQTSHSAGQMRKWRDQLLAINDLTGFVCSALAKSAKH